MITDVDIFVLSLLHAYLQHCLTMKSTEDAETATLTTLFHVVRKGSRFLVTGLIRVVFTEASYSGRICSPSSKWLREGDMFSCNRLT